MKINLTPDEAQLIVDELQNAMRARSTFQPVYAQSCANLASKILRASHGMKPATKPVYRYYGLLTSKKFNLPAQTIWRTDGETVQWTISDYSCPWNEVSPDCGVKTPADLLNTEIFIEVFR